MAKTFLAPCPYVPLDKYSWHSVHPYIVVPHSHCPPLPWNPVVYCFIASAHAITYGLVLEMVIQLLFTFRRWTTLYFCSLLACIIGTTLFAVSFDLRYFTLNVASPIVILTNLGTFLMVGGFNMVLYSRLKVMSKNPVLLHTTLVSIVLVVVAGKVPVVVSQAISTPTAKEIYRIALYLDFLFTIELLALSSIYIFLFWRRFLQSGDVSSHRRAKALFYLLIAAQITVTAMDLIANVLLCMDYYIPTATITPIRFAIKVKIEFVILNRLVLFAQEVSATRLLPYIGTEGMPSGRGAIIHRYARPAPSSNVATAEAIPRHVPASTKSRHLGAPSLIRSQSLPNMSACSITDTPGFAHDSFIMKFGESLDMWSITDITYLGRLVQEDAV